MKSVCVLGLGYIGLPTASILASNGYRVYGVDVSPKIVEIINNGDIHIEEPGLKTLVKAAINSGNLKAYNTPQEADVFIIAVPTPINEDKKADLSYIEIAANSIVDKLKPGNLVILESTSPPGTTKDFLNPILEKSKLKLGEELFVAHCPERVLPGKIIKELIQNKRIIGGIDEKSAQMAKEIYLSFVEGDIHLTDTTTAEMVKIMENTYRDVNIALANELAKISHNIGVNAWEVAELANLHPRVNIHSPSPGVGGHCISVDPWFIVEKVPMLARLINESRDINDSMPEFTYDLLMQQIKDIPNAKITMLGVTYKADVDDVRESPATKIIEMINNNPNLKLSIYDPHVKYFDYELSGFEEAFKESDCILLTVNHSEFKYIDPAQIAKIVKNKLIIDTRNSLDRQKWEKSDFKYILLGEG
ncbi:MAG: UDP-N-acetyl-D-mannosamine dehydrogenase [Candidatus Melainabacteria bacterium GWA2_34_9]|nr:MAG: UDP-N-acetyl-D-mannosamine dehydrogenase [Candidatus Melainabacteria bacterium GWA2_34_9]